MWPDFCDVEDVVWEGFCGGRGEGLAVHGPGGMVSVGDGGEEVLSVPVGVGAQEVGGFVVG